MSAEALTAGLRGFACPYEAMDEELRQAVVGEYARGYLGAFVERFAGLLGDAGPELAEAAGSDIPFQAAWDIAFGRLRRSLLSDAENPSAVAEAILSRLAANGGPPSIRVLNGSEAAMLEPFDDDPKPSQWPAERITGRCREALELLAEYAPIYDKWVRDVVRYLLPRDGSDGYMRSASSMDWPGVISASFPSSPAALAEMLVHESSHQNLNIVRRLGPIVNGEDDGLYHSPVKGRQRPIGAILVAFHAVANMLLFYRGCLDAGIRDDGYCESNLARHSADVRILLDHLESSPGLAAPGRAIVTAAAGHLRTRVLG